MHFKLRKSVSLLSLSLVFIMLGEQIRSSFAVRLCGKELPEALDQICVHGFNPKLKRSFADTMLENEIETDISQTDVLDDYQGMSLLARMLGESALQMAKTRRRRTGIYDECCRKPCAMDELLKYCR